MTAAVAAADRVVWSELLVAPVKRKADLRRSKTQASVFLLGVYDGIHTPRSSTGCIPAVVQLSGPKAVQWEIHVRIIAPTGCVYISQ